MLFGAVIIVFRNLPVGVVNVLQILAAVEIALEFSAAAMAFMGA